MLSDLEGEPMELNLTPDIVVKDLRLQEGNHMISTMKLNLGDQLLAFTIDNANDSVYPALCKDEVCMALKIHQQYFHIYMPQKYKNLEAHTAFLFSMVVLKKQQMKVDQGVKILKDMKKARPLIKELGTLGTESSLHALCMKPWEYKIRFD